MTYVCMNDFCSIAIHFWLFDPCIFDLCADENRIPSCGSEAAKGVVQL